MTLVLWGLHVHAQLLHLNSCLVQCTSRVSSCDGIHVCVPCTCKLNSGSSDFNSTGHAETLHCHQEHLQVHKTISDLLISLLLLQFPNLLVRAVLSSIECPMTKSKKVDTLLLFFNRNIQIKKCIFISFHTKLKVQ